MIAKYNKCGGGCHGDLDVLTARVFTAHNATRTAAQNLSTLKYVARQRDEKIPLCFLSDSRLDNSDGCRSEEVFLFLPCSRKLPFGVGGQLQLRDVGQHRPVAG